MLLFLGLGNPSRASNRHNAGHRFIDCFTSAFSLSAPVTMIKTTTFMNQSGACAQRALKRYAGPLWIAHDDLETPLGQVKWKFGGSAGGHNGIRDIIDKCGADNGRIRIGIGRPQSHISVANYVLSDHSYEALDTLNDINIQLATFILDNLHLFTKNAIDQIRKEWSKIQKAG